MMPFNGTLDNHFNLNLSARNDLNQRMHSTKAGKSGLGKRPLYVRLHMDERVELYLGGLVNNLGGINVHAFGYERGDQGCNQYLCISLVPTRKFHFDFPMTLGAYPGVEVASDSAFWKNNQ